MPTNISAVRDTWRNIEPRGQITMVVSFLLIAVTGYFLYSYATAPSYTTLQTNLNPSTTNQIAQALASAGVKYRISNGGTEVDVVSSQQSQAQIALASKGVGPGNNASLADVQSLGMGTSSFQQQVAYQRGLEGDISTQIESIDGVNAAQVQLVLPTDTLFADQQSAARAAVLLNDNGSLGASTVAGIAHMVSSSVQGLDPSNVTITDNMGQLLWPSAGAGGAGGGASAKIAQQQTYDLQTESAINAMLAQTLGPNKAEAKVNAVLDTDQTTQDAVTYDGKSVPLTVQKDDETLTGTGATAGGAAGTAGNVPPVYQGGTSGAGSSSNYQHTTGTTNYGANKTVTHTVVSPGAIQQQSVAILFDSSVPPKAVTALKQAVSSMVNLQPSRGDVLTTAVVPFTKTAAAGTAATGLAGTSLTLMSIVKYAIAAIASLAFLFMVRRSLKKREKEARFAEPTWLREISQATPLAALEAAGVRSVPSSAVQHREVMQKQAEEIVHSQPEHVALQVQQWMNE
jgi:flagellar M-ring protein FliF